MAGQPLALAADSSGVVVAVQPGEVAELGARDGEERWHAAVANVDWFRPAISADMVVVAARDRHVALDRTDGTLLWERATVRAGPVTLAQLPSGESLAVVATETGALAALDAHDGSVVWAVDFPGNVVTPPVLDPARTTAVVAWHGEAPSLRAVDLVRGTVRWSVPLAEFASSPVVAGDVVVIAEGDGSFHATARALDLATGTQRWTVPLPASFESGIEPVVVGREVGVVDHFGTATLLAHATGRTRWQVETGRPVLDSRILVEQGVVAFRTYADGVVLLERATGTVLRVLRVHGTLADLTTSRGAFVVALRHPGRVEALRLP